MPSSGTPHPSRAPHLPALPALPLPPLCSTLATNLRSYVSRGGVLLLTASLHTNIISSDVCRAPMAAINAVLGSETNSTASPGCSCFDVSLGTGPHGPPYATVSAQEATAVWGPDASALIAAQPAGYRLDVQAVGGIPVRCTDPGDSYDIFPVSYASIPQFPGELHVLEHGTWQMSCC